jgi:hypothetical protein
LKPLCVVISSLFKGGLIRLQKQKARALYKFDGFNPGELPIEPGQVVDVILDDDGGGWVTVSDGSYIGYVPRTYVEYL